MCGIAGFAGTGYRNAITRMNAAQQHRGPDDEGYAFDDTLDLALAMRRLSIVDIAGGHQPMQDASGRYTIVYNGEVFNSPALRCELEAQGVAFKTAHSDTEVILNLFIREGARCVERLNGMFAFAVYDVHEKRLFIARDPLGIKPLYYFNHQGIFAFASELKSLMTLAAAPREIDRQSLHHYLTFQFIPAPRSIYTGIQKLPGGHTLSFCFKSRTIAITRYWQPRFAGMGEAPASRDAVLSRLRAKLERATSDWMLSDVEVGCSLSGGIDSAALVGLLASHGIKGLKTWTLGFAEAGQHGAAIDERALAALVAKRWGTEHHEIVIQASSLLEDLDAMVDSLDEPYAGGLPSWYVFKAMSQHVKVAMVGTGGDELFGNYGKWRILQPTTLPWIKNLRRRLISQGVWECMAYPHGALYPGYFDEREKVAMYRDQMDGLQSSPAWVEALWRASGSHNPKQSVAFVDMQMQLPEEFLMMTDRFSMMWSVEARPPLLDRELVDFVLGLPADLRSPSDRLKGLLIDAVRDLLPDEIVAARKRGFVLPTADWLRNELKPLVERYFGRGFLRQQGIFREDLFDTLARPHLEGRVDASTRIWTVLMFQLWWDRQTEPSA